MPTASSIYASQLLLHGYGYPLWRPSPQPLFGEVLMGDIGFIDDGGFIRLFNPTLGRDHPVNQGGYGVPDRFEELEIDSRHIRFYDITSDVINSESFVDFRATVSGIRQTAAHLDFDFETRHRRSASLAFNQTDPANLVKATGARVSQTHTRYLREYLLRNLPQIRAFVENNQIDLNDHEIVLISGWYKTDHWTVAAAGGTGLRFKLDVGPGVSFSIANGPSDQAQGQRLQAEPLLAWYDTLQPRLRGMQDQCVFVDFVYCTALEQFTAWMGSLVHTLAQSHSLEGARSAGASIDERTPNIGDAQLEGPEVPPGAEDDPPMQSIADYIFKSRKDVPFAVISTMDIPTIVGDCGHSSQSLKECLQVTRPTVYVTEINGRNVASLCPWKEVEEVDPSPCEAPALVGLDTKGTKPRIWALIIAINNYRTTPLRACITDGQAMMEFLKTKLQVPEVQIATLFDEAASRDAILSTFRSHLTHNEAIQKGDIIVFYFAGYGTQELAQASDGWGLDRDMVECICPQNMDWTNVHGIPSMTLNGLFRELASVKGDGITAIFDCCFSGEITKKQERESRYRFTSPPEGYMPVLPLTIDADVRKWWPVKASKNVVPARVTYDALKSHLLLNACRTDEKARDGFFTTALIDAMDHHEGATASLTYSHLFEYVLKPLESQHPECFGEHKNRLILSTTMGVVGGFRMTLRNWTSSTNGSIIVHAGSVHGISSRTTFAVQAHETDSVLGTLTVSNLEDLECVCEFQDAPFEIPEGAQAVVKEWNNEGPILKVFVDTGVTGKYTRLGQPVIPPQLEDSVLTVDTPAQADLAMFPHEKPGETTVERRDPLMGEFARQIVVNLNTCHIQHLIAAAFHFTFHLYRELDPLNVLSMVHLEMYQLREESVGLPQLVEVDDTNYISRERTVAKYKTFHEALMREAYLTDLEPSYGIKIVNNSGHHLYPYLFYFDPTDYSIEIWYFPEPSMPAPLRSRNSLKVGYGTRDSTSAGTIAFSVPPGAESDSGFLKLFLSTSYVDMTFICQGGFAGERQSKMRKIIERELWSAVTYIVTCDSKPSA